MQRHIKLKLSKDQLQAINTSWAYMDFMDTQSPKSKAIISMAQQLAVKFTKKYISIRFNLDANKTYSLKLEYFEAYFLELFMRQALQALPTGYNQQAVQNIADFLNQKLA